MNMSSAVTACLYMISYSGRFLGSFSAPNPLTGTTTASQISLETVFGSDINDHSELVMVRMTRKYVKVLRRRKLFFAIVDDEYK